MELSVQLHACTALSGGKQLPVSLYRKLSGPQSWCGRCGVDKHLLPLPGIEPRQSCPQPTAVLC
jgi:hypothetical protein